MSVRTVTFAENIRPERRGSPYYALEYLLEGTGPYRPVDYVEFMAITSGEGRRVAYGPDGTLTTTPLLPGQFHFFSPNVTHEIYSLGSPTMGMRNVAMLTSIWEQFVDIAELDRSWAMAGMSRMIVVDVESPEIAGPFRRAAERYRGRPRVLDAIEFLTAVARFFVPPEPIAVSGGPPWLRQALATMTTEDELRGGVARLTELARVDPTHLWRTMRRYTGLSPSEFVLTVRMRHAAALLSTTDASIGSIGERCGFPSASHFGQVFRRFHGVSPREHRALGEPRGPA